ncbi:hypothetical protein HanPI659440_Chr03g0124631 [Helianthus annuus]|nr:hypothetical protein HanPI659440_Chr03g0124631 [Helianthus annuus]
MHTETEYWTSCVAQERRGEVLSIKLYQFTSSQREHEFKLDFLGHLCRIHDHHLCTPRRDKRRLHVIGVEFVPLEYVSY